MLNATLTLINRVRSLVLKDDGQDLIEYALILALIALGATAGMNSVASDINSAFSSIGSTLNGYTG